jgi:uncharacterized protein YllA (UPF0747 family)
MAHHNLDLTGIGLTREQQDEIEKRVIKVVAGMERDFSEQNAAYHNECEAWRAKAQKAMKL